MPDHETVLIIASILLVAAPVLLAPLLLPRPDHRAISLIAAGLLAAAGTSVFVDRAVGAIVAVIGLYVALVALRSWQEESR